MASPISSSGSGTPGRKKVEPGRTKIYTQLPSLQTFPRSPISPRRVLGWLKTTQRHPRRDYPLSRFQETSLRTSRTKGLRRPIHLKAKKIIFDIVPILLAWSPPRVPRFHHQVLVLLLFQVLHLPLHNLQFLFKPPTILCTCLLATTPLALRLRPRHLYLYRLAQQTSQESTDLPLARLLNPQSRPFPLLMSHIPPHCPHPKSTHRSLHRLRTCTQASLSIARS